MQNNKHPKISILLLNWNNWKDTKQCLESLRHITYPNFDIILVDNGSSDDSLSNMQIFKDKNTELKISILKNKQNLGFGGGNNIGINFALNNNSDYVLLLNNDTSVASDFLESMIAVTEDNPKVGLVSPSIFFYDKRDLLWFGGPTYFRWSKMDKAAGVKLFKKPLGKNPKPTRLEFASGACMLIKRDVLKKIDGFYPPYFLYFEDIDLSFAIKKTGYNLVWVPNSSIWHKVSATTLPALGSNLLNYYNHRNILLLAKRHGPLWVRYFYMHIWAIYKYFKQLVKIMFGYNREISRAIKQGIEDYYRNNLGKYKVR